MRVLAIVVALAAGCGEPHIETCALACEPATGCPDGFECSWGRCAAQGSTCPACEPAALAQTPCIESLAAGGHHSCALDACHQLWCWGANEAGQLGFTSPAIGPAHPDALVQPVAGQALGHAHSCAIVFGDVYCWGYDHELQLGLPSAALAPTANGLTGVEAITAGQHHTCVLLHDRSVWCLGQNDEGQLGIAAATVTTATPLHVFDGASAVAAGEFHTCAIRDGGVWCWGQNDWGAVDATGFHTGGARVTAPMQVRGLDHVIELALGDNHSCARRSDGSVVCWGDNRSGQLGQHDTASHLGTVQVIAAGATALAAHWAHTCALVDGSVECWGDNSAGQVDGAPSALPVTEPRPVPELGRAYALAAGGSHSCAIVEHGVACWGDNSEGQLGPSSSTRIHAPLVCDVTRGATPPI